MCHRGESSLSRAGRMTVTTRAVFLRQRHAVVGVSPGEDRRALLTSAFRSVTSLKAQAKENHNMNTPSLALQACGSFSRGLHPWLGLYATRR